MKRHARMLSLLGKETEVPYNRYQIYKLKENGINIVVFRSLNQPCTKQSENTVFNIFLFFAFIT